MGYLLKHGKLYSLVMLFFLLAMAYNVALPLGRGYDEVAHFRYIRFIAEQHRPPITEAEQGQGGYKSRHHPPFYHGLTGLLFSWVDSEDTVFKQINFGDIPKYALIQDVLDVHWFLHTEIMNFPYQGAVLLWHLSRLFSSLLAAGTLIVVYFTVLELYPGQKCRALLAAAALAFIPRFVFTGSVASDDNLLAFLMAIYLLLMIRIIKGQQRRLTFALIGIVLGLAITTKFSVALVPITTVVVFGFLAWQQTWSRKDLIKRIALVAVSAGLVASWWFIFVIWNFNEIESRGLIAGIFNPLVPNVANNVSGADLLNHLQGQSSIEREALQPGEWLLYFTRSFWAVPFTDRLYGFPMSPAVFWGLLAAMVLVVIGWVKSWQQASQFQRSWLGLLTLHILAFFPLMVGRYYLNGIIFETAQGRHVLMPAASAVGILLMAGWAGWTRVRWMHWAWPVLPALLLFWSLGQLHAIYNVFPKPLPVSINPETQTQLETPANRPVIDSVEFLGYSVALQPNRDLLQATLAWQVAQPAAKDYLTQVRLLNKAGEVVSGWIEHPANGFYPTRVWDSGEVVYNQIQLPLNNVAPGVYTLEAHLVEAYTQPLRQVSDALFAVPVTIEQLAHRQSGFQHLPLELDGETIQVGYQLWPPDPLRFNRPQFHYRSTIPILWQADGALPAGVEIKMALAGPDDRLFEPLAEQGNLKLFMVGADWPAGSYRLKVEAYQNGQIVQEKVSAPALDVQNRQRRFTAPAITRRIDANFYNHFKLLGYDLPNPRVQPGDELSVFVYWQNLEIVNANLIMFNQLYDADNNLWASFDHILPPYYGGTILWVPGEVVQDGYTIPIAPDAPDGIYTLRVGLFLGMGDNAWVSLPLVDDNGQALEINYATLGPIRIGDPPARVLAVDPNPSYPRDDNLGDVIKLKGYDLARTPKAQELALTLYWESLASTHQNLTTFVHLLDGNGQIIAQKDSPPAGGLYPTSVWDMGDIVKDEIVLAVPDSGSTGDYTLRVGMYNFLTGERLPLINSSDSAILLRQLELESLLR